MSYVDINTGTAKPASCRKPCSREKTSPLRLCISALPSAPSPTALHRPAHKCTLANAPTLSCDVPKAVHKPHSPLAHVPSRLNRKRHIPDSIMIWHILPEQCPLGLFSPRRSQLSFLGSLSRVGLSRRMLNHDIHCRKLKQCQHRPGIKPCPACRPGPCSEAPPPIGSCRQRPGARSLPGYHCASGSSWLPSRRLSHHLVRQQLLHCICTVGGHVSGNAVPQAAAVPHIHNLNVLNEHVVAECHVSCSTCGHRSRGHSGTQLVIRED